MVIFFKYLNKDIILTDPCHALIFSETNFIKAQKLAVSGYKSHGIQEIH